MALNFLFQCLIKVQKNEKILRDFKHHEPYRSGGCPKKKRYDCFDCSKRNSFVVCIKKSLRNGFRRS